jgi:hypothetical protein
MKFLEAKYVGILVQQLLHHFLANLTTRVIILFYFNKPGHIPRDDSQHICRFLIVKFSRKMEGKKNADTFPADQQYDQQQQ